MIRMSISIKKVFKKKEIEKTSTNISNYLTIYKRFYCNNYRMSKFERILYWNHRSKFLKFALRRRPLTKNY